LDVKAAPPADAASSAVSAEQRLYARWLAVFVRIGAIAVVAISAAYFTGLVPGAMTPERSAALWTLPVGAYLASSGHAAGWAWLGSLPDGESLCIAAIAYLASCSIPCLLLTAAGFARRGERVFLALCVAEAGFLALTASGLLTAP
jgi:hypothetical protein